jgi:HEAT repeats
MRYFSLCLITFTLCAADTPATRMFDTKLNEAQRNDACYALRGDKNTETLQAMRRGLGLELLRACAGRNLEVAGASAELLDAMNDPAPEVRASAVRHLGALQNPEFLPLIAKAADDPNLLIATNAINGLVGYEDRSALPYLEKIAPKGGILGILSLDRAAQMDPIAALRIARKLLSSVEVTDRVVALRVIAQNGDASDLPALRVIAATKTESAVPQRGFGLMPSIDLGRAARGSILQIEGRLNH